MMTVSDMIRAANLARHEGRDEDAAAWTSLYIIIGRIEAAARLAMRQADPHQQDQDEYDEEMSLGGRPYRSMQL